MLKQLDIKNFTVFSEASFQFASGLNIIIGENGTGKSHILKLAYSLIFHHYPIDKELPQHIFLETKDRVFNKTREKIANVFHTKLSELRKKNRKTNASNPLWVNLRLDGLIGNLDIYYYLDDSLKEELNTTPEIEAIIPQSFNHKKLVFLPTRELLTIYPGFASLYTNRYLEFDETYYDTCLLLGEPLLKKPNKKLLAILEQAMNGKVELEGGRFYLISNDGLKIEMPLVAEGLRKLAMLAQLIAVGALEKGSYLFWDEPEANLNPRLIKVVAKVILQLAEAGIQIFIATHSLFLLRELNILQAAQKRPTPQRYFALKKIDDGVEVEQGSSIEDIQTLVLLDEELQQSDRYMAVE